MPQLLLLLQLYIAPRTFDAAAVYNWSCVQAYHVLLDYNSLDDGGFCFIHGVNHPADRTISATQL